MRLKAHEAGASRGSGATAPAATPFAGVLPGCEGARLSLGTPGETASSGRIERTFVLTDTSRSSCTLPGYPGMQMLDSGGRPVPTTVVREQPATRAQTVVLAPGGAATFLAWWWNQNRYTVPCPLSQRVEVTPPNAVPPLTITLSIQPCPDGTINVSPVTAGSS